jgi:hypothetical protein
MPLIKLSTSDIYGGLKDPTLKKITALTYLYAIVMIGYGFLTIVITAAMKFTVNATSAGYTEPQRANIHSHFSFIYNTVLLFSPLIIINAFFFLIASNTIISDEKTGIGFIRLSCIINIILIIMYNIYNLGFMDSSFTGSQILVRFLPNDVFMLIPPVYLLYTITGYIRRKPLYSGK